MLLNFVLYPVALTAFMEVLEGQVSTRFEVQSYVCACLVLFITVFYLVTMWMIPLLHHKRATHPLFKYRLAMFFWAFKPTLSA